MPQNSFAPQQAFPQNPPQGNQERIASFNRPGGYPESPLSPKRPYPSQKKPGNTRTLLMVAALCVIVGGLLLVLITVLSTSGSNNASSNTALTSATSPTAANSTVAPQATSTPTAASDNATPTVSDSPTTTGTAYPGQQYIDNAQMAMGVDNKTMQPQQPTTTFPVNTNMYVIFDLHPPTQGGEVCAIWYLQGSSNPVTSYNFDVKGTSHASYTFASYGSPGQAYVELYWASDKSCSDKILAQHVDFTVTAS